MFDIPCCYWQTHSWMTLSNLLSTELRSGLLGGHIWCVVQIFMSQQLSALAHAWCAGKQKAPAAATVWAARHHSNMHHSLSPLATWKPHQCTSWRHWLKPTRKNMFIRYQWGTSMSWSSIWLKRGQQPAELRWPSDWSVAMRVSKPKANTEHLL